MQDAVAWKEAGSFSSLARVQAWLGQVLDSVRGTELDGVFLC